MTDQQTIELIKKFQKWRLGEIPDYFPFKHKELTEALSIVLKLAEEKVESKPPCPKGTKILIDVE